MSLADLLTATGLPKPELAATLNHLAYSGQIIHDLSVNAYRWRQIMPQALGEAEIGPENAELAASRTIIDRNKVILTKQEPLSNNTRLLTGKAESTSVEIILDAEDRIKRGKCLCSHYKTFGLRNGPCRHMLALRFLVTTPQTSVTPASFTWEDRLRRMFDDN
jgi:hypothetical protein